MIYAALAILVTVAGIALWLFRRGKKEAYGETAEKAIKEARKAAGVDIDTSRMSDSDVRDRLSNDWTRE